MSRKLRNGKKKPTDLAREFMKQVQAIKKAQQEPRTLGNNVAQKQSEQETEKRKEETKAKKRIAGKQQETNRTERTRQTCPEEEVQI